MLLPICKNVGEFRGRHLTPRLEPLGNVLDAAEEFVQRAADTGVRRRHAKRKHGRGEAGTVGEENDASTG